jgi:hypothetical protein
MRRGSPSHRHTASNLCANIDGELVLCSERLGRLLSSFIVLRVFVLRFRLGISIVVNLGITAAFSFLVDFLDLSFFLPLA